MIEYKSDVFHPLSNYELEEIIDFLNNHEKAKNWRTKLSIDSNKLKVKLFSKWETDFTMPNTIGRVLGFKKRVLRAFMEHISDFSPKLFKLRAINIHCHLVNSNIVNEYTHSDIIYSFQVNYEKIGTSTIKEPNTILYYPLTDTEITQLRIDIRDQDGKHIEFREPVIICLAIRLISYWNVKLIILYIINEWTDRKINRWSFWHVWNILSQLSLRMWS